MPFPPGRMQDAENFAVLPKEDCTVGALRARAADVDVSLRSTGKKSSGPATVADLPVVLRQEVVVYRFADWGSYI